jgi:hypothetical protein
MPFTFPELLAAAAIAAAPQFAFARYFAKARPDDASIAASRRREVGLVDHVFCEELVAPDTMLTTYGALGAMYELRWRDTSVMSDVEAMEHNAWKNKALRRLGGSRNGWMAQNYVLPEELGPLPMPDYVVGDGHRVLSESHVEYASGNRFRWRYFTAFTYQPPEELNARVSGLVFSGEKPVETSPEKVAATFEEGLRAVEGDLRVEGTPRRLGTHPLDAGRSEFLEAIYHVVFGDRQAIAQPNPFEPFPVGGMLASRELPRGGITPMVGDKHLRVLSVFNLPKDTQPNMMEAFLTSAVAGSVYAQRMIFQDVRSAKSKIDFARRSQKGKNAGKGGGKAVDRYAQILEGKAEDALLAADVGDIVYTHYSAKVVFLNRDLEALLAGLDVVKRAFEAKGFTVNPETVNTLDGWFGMWPFNGFHDVREGQVHTMNAARMWPSSSRWAGRQTWTCKQCGPETVPALTGTTATGEPFYFDPHGPESEQNFVQFGSPGCGKALATDTPILTPSGYRPIGDVCVGDVVIGKNGHPTTVTGVYPQGKKQAFRATFNDGATVVCCDDHLWQVNVNGGRRNRTSVRHEKGREGQPYRTTFREQVLQFSEVRERIEKGSTRIAIPLVDPVQFAYRDLPLDPYLVGAMIGDGTCSVGSALSFSSPDEGVLEEVRAALAPTGTELVHSANVTYRVSKTTRRRGVENPFNVAMGNLGLRVHSWEKFVPNAYKYAHEDARRGTLQGLFDTDGSVASPGRAEYSTASKRLADDIVFMCQSLGWLVTRTERSTWFTYLGERKAGRTSYRLQVRVPEGQNPFRFARKHDAFKARSEYRVTRRFVKVEDVGERDMVCIAVDAPDHLYVVGGCVVTHNTTDLNALAASYRRRPTDAVRAIDKNRGQLVTCKFLGGSYHDDEKYWLFGDLERPEKRWKVAKFLTNLGAIGGVEIGFEQRNDVQRTLELLLEYPTAHRSLSTFVNLLGPIDREGAFSKTLAQYQEGGVYRGRFDGVAPIETNVDDSYEVHEMGALLGAKQDVEVAGPVMMWLLNSFEDKLPGRRTLIPWEEAWTSIQGVVASLIEELLRTIRFRHGGIGFYTHSLAEIKDSPIGKIVFATCPTRVIYPNRDAAGEFREFFEGLELSPSQIDAVRNGEAKKIKFLSVDGKFGPFSRTYSPAELAIYGCTGYDEVAAAQRLIEEHPDDWDERQLRAYGCGREADRLRSLRRQRITHADARREALVR